MRARFPWRSTLLLLLVAACVAADSGRLTKPINALEPQDNLSVGALRFRGAVTVAADGVGGLSGLWVSEDGRRLVAVSDTGRLVTGHLTYDPQGRLAAAGDIVVTGLPIDVRAGSSKRWQDSEEILRLPPRLGGGWLVSFEREHRILRYRATSDALVAGGPAGDPAGGTTSSLGGGPAGRPVPLPLPAALDDAPENGGIEAMAVLADGRLLIIEEGSDDGLSERRAWISAGLPERRSDWRPLTYRAAPGFRPVGAAALPDGGVLVLERRASLLGGWGTRITRIGAAALRPGAAVEGDELANIGEPLPVDNFEGIAVRPGVGGETLIYLVSDDNFMPFQRTYVMMLAFPSETKDMNQKPMPPIPSSAL